MPSAAPRPLSSSRVPPPPPGPPIQNGARAPAGADFSFPGRPDGPVGPRAPPRPSAGGARCRRLCPWRRGPGAPRPGRDPGPAFPQRAPGGELGLPLGGLSGGSLLASQLSSLLCEERARRRSLFRSGDGPSYTEPRSLCQKSPRAFNFPLFPLFFDPQCSSCTTQYDLLPFSAHLWDKSAREGACCAPTGLLRAPHG